VKILVLAPHAFYIDRGTPIDVDILLRALSVRGEQIDVLVYHEGENRKYPNVRIHRIHPPRFVKHVGPGFSLKKLLCDLFLVPVAWKLVRTGRHDVIHAGEESVFLAMLFKVIFGIPYVYDMDSSIAQQLVEKIHWFRPLAGFFNWCERRAIRGGLAVAPVCNALADLARSRGALCVETLHDISQLGDSDPLSRGELRGRLGIQGLILMYVGNLERYQGVDLLLDAVAIVQQRGGAIDLVIAGGTSEAISKYQERARSLGVAQRVHLIGSWPIDRLADLLAEADILTAPRITGINTPMKVFPYMHSGKPVLVTDLPTHSQILNQDIAMLAPPDPQGFAEGILALATDHALRERLGAAGRRFVELNHTFEAHQRRVDRLYDIIQTRCDAVPRSSKEEVVKAKSR